MKKDVDEELLTEMICILDYMNYNCLLSTEMKNKVRLMIQELKEIITYMEVR